ncbi:gag-pol polyprotein [Hordeum vulgare]|nr:gag-pol polyprotein [Hordeum vulgare]
MSKPDELQNDASKSDFTTIPLSGIDYAESTTTLFEDGVMTITTTELLKEHSLEASDKVARKDDASMFGGESEMIKHVILPSVMEAGDDVQYLSFIHGDDEEMVEHGSFALIITTFVDVLSDLCHHIVSKTVFTASPIYDEFPQFSCEERHNPHHLSEMNDSTICEYECNYLEGVSEIPPHRASEVVDWACEAISISNNLMSTSIVSSPFVLGPIYDDAAILDHFIPPMDKTAAMVEYDAPPTWFHYNEDDYGLVFSTSPTPHEWNAKGNIAEIDALVPLVEIDCLHDDYHSIAMLHDYVNFPTNELPIYDEFDDYHVESISCDAMLHRIPCERSKGHIMFHNPLDLSYALHEIHHIASLQSHHSNYGYAIKINPICKYSID